MSIKSLDEIREYAKNYKGAFKSKEEFDDYMNNLHSKALLGGKR